MNDAQRVRLLAAAEQLFNKRAKVNKEHPEIQFGCTAEYRSSGKIDDDPQRCAVSMEYDKLIEPEKTIFSQIVDEILAEQPPMDCSNYPKLDDTNLYLWGGPTPYWGGSMADDTLVRAAEYYNAVNGVYVYGPTDEKAMQTHSNFRKLLCQINSNCRTPGAQGDMDDRTNAEALSKLSLKYPNIVGAMCDDVTTKFLKICLPEQFEARYQGLKKYNPALKMYGVIYVHELCRKNFSLIQDYLDVINLWFWHFDEILDYDKHINLCHELFPGKPIIQGIFLHEYGISDSGNLPALLRYQLDKTREYMHKGIVEGAILLGDREIAKWPTAAEAVRDYLCNQ